MLALTSWTLVVLTMTAHAAGEDCAALLASDQSPLSQAARERWITFHEAIKSAPTYARNDFFLHLMQRKYRAGVKALIEGVYTSAEERAICDGIVQAYAAKSSLNFDAERVTTLYDRFCADDPGAAKRLTARALRAGFVDYPRRGLGGVRERNKGGDASRRWLTKVIREQKFSAGDWLELTTARWEPRVVRDGDFGSTTYHDNGPGAVLALADAVDGDFTRAGWVERDVLEVAGKLLEKPLPVTTVTRWLELSEAQLESLRGDFLVSQWLEDEHRRGRIDLETPRRLAQIIDERAGRGDRFGGGIEKIVRDLILDPTVPYDIAISIHDLVKARWTKIAPQSSSLYVVSPDRFALNEEQLNRAERFYGRGTIRPEAVWTEARAAARDVAAALRAAKFGTVPEFMATFAFTRFFTPPKDRELDEVEAARVRALAEVYFEVLRERLSEFLALNPRAIDVRWLLETPLRIPLSLHNDGLWRRQSLPPWRRWLTPANAVIGPGEYLTSGHIFKLLDEVLRQYVPRITSIEDFNEVMTFGVRGAFEYEQFQRDAADRYAAHATRIGDARLDWTEIPRFENAQAWKMRRSVDDLKAYGTLVRLRELVPAAERSDQTLTAKAIELILGYDLGDLAGEAIRAHLNNPFRKAILAFATDDPDQLRDRDVSPEDQRAWVKAMQVDLLEFLHARATAGAKISIAPSQVDALRNVAAARGFDVHSTPDGDGLRLSIFQRPR